MIASNNRRNDPKSHAIDTLIRAGRGAEVQALYERYSATAHAQYDQIRSEAGRTPEWIDEQLAAAYATIRANADAEIIAKAATAGTDDRHDASRVFGIADLPGDPASLAISARDAADRVANVTTPDDLRDLLDRATRVGDELLARAVAERALDLGHRSILDDFAATRPQLADAIKRLWNQANRDIRDAGFALAMAATGLKP